MDKTTLKPTTFAEQAISRNQCDNVLATIQRNPLQAMVLSAAAGVTSSSLVRQ